MEPNNKKLLNKPAPVISPNKKPAAPLSSAQLKGASDIPLSNADGPRGSLGGAGANSENSMFNKHYNKELKLCEGKSHPPSNKYQTKYQWCSVN